jgi:hypothetical protein
MSFLLHNYSPTRAKLKLKVLYAVPEQGDAVLEDLKTTIEPQPHLTLISQP